MLRGEREIFGDKSESEDVMTRSRVWFLLWVGKLTWLIRLSDERSFRNLDARGSEGSSTWILKSPTSKNSCGVVAASESKEPSSSRITGTDLEE